MEERRRYVRSNGLILVDYKGLQIKGKSSAFDASGAGVRITLNKELEVDSPVEMEIYLPGDSQPIKASGKVIWVRKVKEEKFFIGIEFTVIDNNSVTKIVNYVSRRIKLVRRR